MKQQIKPGLTSPGSKQISELSGQIRQFIKFDIPANVLAMGLLFWAYVAAADHFVVLAAIGIVFANTLVVAAAWLPLTRGNLPLSATLLAVGHWFVAVGIVIIIPGVMPIMAMLVSWPVLFMAPYVSSRQNYIFSAIGVILMVFLVYFGRTVDYFEFVKEENAEWLLDIGMYLALPVVTAITFLILGHQGKRVQRALESEIQANDELRTNERLLERKVMDRTAELATARDTALAATQAKSAFLATMSHEIRTPLNGVLGMNSLLLETSLSSHQRELASTVETSGTALLSIINDVLDFSKIEAGKLDLEMRPFSVREIIETTAEMVAVAAAAKKIELAYLVDKDVPAVIQGDADRLRQILLNLLNNAVKFTDVGEVFLSAHLDGIDNGFCSLRIAVKDTGVGIPADQIGSLFEEFAQLDSSTTRNFGGTGLGLAISQRLAMMMDGTVSATSSGNNGEGSIFTVTIRGEIAEATGVPDYIELANRSVLVVDDNQTNRRILQMQTESWGLVPSLTGSPLEAVKWVESGEQFDIALLDLHMPQMDGLELARILNATDPSLLMLILSSHGSDIADFPQGVGAVLTKPVKPSALNDAIVNMLSRQPDSFRQTVAEKPAQRLDGLLADSHPLDILVAEDNEVNQRLIRYALDSLGYDVTIVENGLQAVQAVRDRVYDVILMDLQMPVMDGLAAAKEICTHRGSAHTPRIIAMTANVMPEDRQLCSAAGMDGFLAKPIDIDQIEVELTRTKRHVYPGSSSGSTTSKIVSAVPEPELESALERLLLTVGGNQNLVLDIISNFMDDAVKVSGELQSALDSGQFKTVERLAHSLKGNALLFGDRTCAALVAQLENSANTESHADVASNLEAVVDSIQNLVERLGKMAK